MRANTLPQARDKQTPPPDCVTLTVSAAEINPHMQAELYTAYQAPSVSGDTQTDKQWWASPRGAAIRRQGHGHFSQSAPAWWSPTSSHHRQQRNTSFTLMQQSGLTYILTLIYVKYINLIHLNAPCCCPVKPLITQIMTVCINWMTMQQCEQLKSPRTTGSATLHLYMFKKNVFFMSNYQVNGLSETTCETQDLSQDAHAWRSFYPT